MKNNRLSAREWGRSHHAYGEEAPQRVFKKLGFQKEGLLREYYCRDGIYNDQVQFSLLT